MPPRTPSEEARMALELATKANHRVDGHEQLCTERWNASNKKHEQVLQGVIVLSKRIWALVVSISGGALVLLLTAVGVLVMARL